MEWINEKKKMKIKKALSYKGKVYSIVFSMLEDEIREMLKDGYSKTIIVKILNEELETNINYFTFIKWFDKNIKQKNQNSNNLKRNTKKDEVKKDINNPKKEIPKQNNTTSTTPNTPKKEDDGKPWWEKRLEELSKGMEEAGIRR